ncbi:MAG: S-layer homology domain-containing protein, partial [Clostridia bacterium]|nr:S-layer homology domain-containing protein [Clostridia bacterium]
MKKDFCRLFSAVLCVVLAFSAVSLVTAETQFTDISGHWAENIIERWQNSGYINGYPDGSFKPDSPITRAELSKILTAAFDLGSSTDLEYDDVEKDEWYYTYLQKSAKYIPTYSLVLPYENNIPYAKNDENGVKGFLPNENALRIHVAEALAEIKREKEGISDEDLTDTKIMLELPAIFKDAETLATPKGETPEGIVRMHKYMYLAYKYNIMVGFDGYFNPDGYMTRAEVITAIDNMKNNYITATYLGVENYGEPETNKDNKNDFRYRFLIDGEEKVLAVDNGIQADDGSYDYPIQNLLKENYSYRLKIDGDTVIFAEESKEVTEEFTPVVSGKAGEKTLINFLKTAMEPVGTTLYIYGGGWDWQDVGSSVQARTLGVSPDWVRFFAEHDE